LAISNVEEGVDASSYVYKATRAVFYDVLQRDTKSWLKGNYAKMAVEEP
jgi:hypothetical protein